MKLLGELQAVWKNYIADVKLIDSGEYLRVTLPQTGFVFLPGDIYLVDTKAETVILP
ncbi:hypothetical protein [Limosilactobacillus gastricus]|uniref:hypothetical protein n=1 Tax=Limosilactobacillus gastricus TaxID=227942 RepID=UPI0026EB78A7|nr:hypothetical protein [Limosilactobacillus gastricus]